MPANAIEAIVRIANTAAINPTVLPPTCSAKMNIGSSTALPSTIHQLSLSVAINIYATPA